MCNQVFTTNLSLATAVGEFLSVPLRWRKKSKRRRKKKQKLQLQTISLQRRLLGILQHEQEMFKLTFFSAFEVTVLVVTKFCCWTCFALFETKRNDFMAFHILSTIQLIIKCILPIYRETLTSWMDSLLLFNTAAELFYWKEWRPISTASMKTAMHIDRNLTPGRWQEIYVPLMRRRQNLKSLPICSRPSEWVYHRALSCFRFVWTIKKKSRFC